MFFNSLKSRLAMLFGVVLVSFTIIGCGSGGNTATGGDKVVITEENRDQVVSSAAIALNLSLEAGHIYFSMDPSTSTNVVKSSANLKTIAVSETTQCEEGGSYTYDSDEAGVLTYVYNDCKEYGHIQNGTSTWKKDGNVITETFTNYHYSKSTYSSLFYESATLKRTVDDEYNTLDMSLEANGYFKESGIQTDVEDYQIEATYEGTNLTFSASGRMKATGCLDKWVEVETVTAMKMSIIDFQASCPTAGEFKVLGGDNTSLTMKFNADKSVDVSINGGSNEHYNNCDDLPDAEEVCQ